MKINSALLLIAALCLAASAQTVKIRPHKVTYHRPKPQVDFKKSFTIIYPKVHARTAALSRKIERAISYESVLQLRLQDEMHDIQWLEEASYFVQFNRNGILCIELSVEGSGAYPSSQSKMVVVDTRTGDRIKTADVFTNLPELARMVRVDQVKEIKEGIALMKKEEPDYSDPETLFESADYKPKDLDGFAATARGVTFYYYYGFPHVIQALQPDGAFFYKWSQLRPFIKKGSPLTRISR